MFPGTCSFDKNRIPHVFLVFFPLHRRLNAASEAQTPVIRRLFVCGEKYLTAQGHSGVARINVGLHGSALKTIVRACAANKNYKKDQFCVSLVLHFRVYKQQTKEEINANSFQTAGISLTLSTTFTIPA